MANEFYLPLEITHHIQSFLNAKESAQTSVLSKSWYTAWSTQPVLIFDEGDFPGDGYEHSRTKLLDTFSRYCQKTLNRYERLKLKPKKFVLSMASGHSAVQSQTLVDKFILSALRLGVSDVELEFCTFSPSGYYLPARKVFESASLTRLSIASFKIHEKIGKVLCSRLTSLVLHRVWMRVDVVQDIILECPLIENLVLDWCGGFEKLNVSNQLNLVRFRMRGTSKKHPERIEFMDTEKGSGRNVTEFHYLRNLDLRFAKIGDYFFNKLSSMFPCLEDLSIGYFKGYEEINVSSHSLKRLTLYEGNMLKKVQLNVPNISKFVFQATFPSSRYFEPLPSLFFDNVSRDYECNVVLDCSSDILDASWFVGLRTFLSELSLSTISLAICFTGNRVILGEEIPCFSPLPVVDNLTVCGCVSANTAQHLMFGLSTICCPNHITECKAGYGGYDYDHCC